MYEPQIGESVWIRIWMIDGEYDIVEHGVVRDIQIVDKHNGYIVHVVDDCDVDPFAVSPECIFQTYADLLREQLSEAMDERDEIQRKITRLECELDATTT